MTIADKTVLVTGANRGIGQPLAHPDRRDTPLTLDVTSPAVNNVSLMALAALPLTPAYSRRTTRKGDKTR